MSTSGTPAAPSESRWAAVVGASPTARRAGEIFDDAVATQDTVTQLVAAIARPPVWCPGPPQVITEVCARDYTKAGKPDIDWDDPQAKTDLVSTLVNDALAALARLCEPVAPQWDPATADALGLLALVAGQDMEPPTIRTGPMAGG